MRILGPKTDALLSSSMRRASYKCGMARLELKSSRTFLAIKRSQETKRKKDLSNHKACQKSWRIYAPLVVKLLINVVGGHTAYHSDDVCGGGGCVGIRWNFHTIPNVGNLRGGTFSFLLKGQNHAGGGASYHSSPHRIEPKSSAGEVAHPVCRWGLCAWLGSHRSTGNGTGQSRPSFAQDTKILGILDVDWCTRVCVSQNIMKGHCKTRVKLIFIRFALWILA